MYRRWLRAVGHNVSESDEIEIPGNISYAGEDLENVSIDKLKAK